VTEYRLVAEPRADLDIAATIGVTIPPSVLVRADRVIQ
jgi:hypothetical protein